MSQRSIVPCGHQRTNTFYIDVECRTPLIMKIGGAMNRSMKVAALMSVLLICCECARASTTTFTGATNNDWFTATNWTNGVPSSTNDPIINSGTADLGTGSASVTNFTITGGAITGTTPATLAVTATFTWSGGSLNGSLTISTADLTIDTGGSKNFGGATLNMSGAGTWTGAADIAASGPSFFNIQNGATFSIQNDQAFGTGNNVTVTVSNGGALQKVAGAGTTSINNFSTLVNNGSVKISSGANTILDIGASGSSSGNFDAAPGTKIRFISNAKTLSAGATMTNTGTFEIAGSNLSINSTFSVANLTVSSGFMNGTGTVTVTNALNWTGGGFSGTGTTTVPVGATLAISGNSGKSFDQRTLNLSGMGTWSGLSDITASNISFFNILSGATFDIQNDQTIGSGNNISVTIAAGGILQKSGGVGTTIINNFSTLNNNGAVLVKSGAGTGINIGAAGTCTGNYDAAPNTTITFSSSTQTLNVSATLTNTGNFVIAGANMIFNASFIVANLSLSSGTMNGSGTVTVSNAFTWNSGTLSGSGITVIPSGATMAIATTGAKSWGQRTLNLSGAGTWTGAADIAATGPGLFNILSGGSFTIQNDQIFSSGNAIAVAISGGGTLTKNTTAGTTTFAGSVTNSGTINATSGTISFNNSLVQNAGMFNLSGGNLSGTVTINGGTLTGTGSIAGNVTNKGSIVIAGANTAGSLNITGSYTQTSTGALSIDIGGTGAGTTYDQLTVTSNVSLGGALNVALFNSFTPGANTFNVVTSGGTLSGTFPTVSNGNTGLSPSYTSSAAILSTSNNPIPVITSINPQTLSPGSAGFSMTITGANFVSGSTVLWTGQTALTPANVSAGLITVNVPASYIATPGTITVSVSNPAPGGGTSNGATFTVNSSNPTPTLTAIAPASATVGGAAFNLTVTGTNFIATSVVNFNGLPKQTTLVSPTQLTAAITAADLSTVASVTVTVTSPQPGGGTTAAQFFTITPALPGGGGTVGGGFGPPQPPFLASGPFATPNPAVAGQPVTLVAAAGDVNGDTLAYTWTFGDGTFGTGSAVSHTYASAGVYTAIVSVSDGTNVVSDSVDVAVNAAAASGTLNIQKAGIKFAFKSANKDSLTFSGTLTGVTSATAVTLQIGTLKKTFAATDKTSKFTLKNGKVAISIKNAALFDDLKDFGFMNTTVAKPGIIVTIDVILTVDGVSFVQSLDMSYTAKAGTSGSAVK